MLYSCACAKQPPSAKRYFDLYGISEDVDIVGSSLYQENIVQAVAARRGDRLNVALVPEPANPHDKYAVRVDVIVNGQQLKAGYLRRGEAREYHKLLRPLAEDGVIGVAKARAWKGDAGWRLYLRLNGPEWALPRKAPVDDGLVLIAERETVVTGEEDFQPALKALIGRRKSVEHTFRLDLGSVPTGRNIGAPAIAAYDGENQVGRLTVGKSAEYMSAVRHALGRGFTPYAIGIVERDPNRGIQVTLYLPISKYRSNAEQYFYSPVTGPNQMH
ncbi:hypothetical protein EV379_1996 [Microterricola gilva]|uniref:HIRAN domain-containing protein n=2 Tax=Microterricola gilva TaxID=393267 RepID=A0A4Q8AM48_9MICO|nr:hypothetical protein EV379_1996 [Microterricola gilva]